MKNSIISVENLTKTYKIYNKPSDRLRDVIFPWKKRHTLFNALSDVTFSVKKGRHLGILGVNGAGKSTLLQLISGVLSPSSGRININGSIAALLELGVGFNTELTGRENVRFLAPMLGIMPEETDDFFQKICAFAELGDFIDQPVKLYSSGMFARLAFAMNISSQPDILIVDEALAVGDAFFQQKCLRKMKEYRECGTVLFVSHDITAIKNLCDDALWLEKGAVREYGPAESVCQHYFESCYAKISANRQQISQALANLPEDNWEKRTSVPQQETILEMMRELRQSPVSDFENKDSFGEGGAKILRCCIENISQQSSIFKSGDVCRISAYFICFEDISNIILGFHFKNRLAVPVFGTNTFHYCQRVSCTAGQICAAIFEFNMLDFAQGEYMMNIALTEGTLENHRVLQWINDAMCIKCESKQHDGNEVSLKCTLCTIINEES